MTLRESILRDSGLFIEDDENENKEESKEESSADDGNYLTELKKLADGELVASMQYSMAANSIVGENNLEYIKNHLSEHSDDEAEHYEQLINALLQRNGATEYNLSKTISEALPKTEELTEFSTDYLRDFFERAENNAIEAYKSFYEKIEEKDKDLADIINGIISDERDHKFDFQRLKKGGE